MGVFLGVFILHPNKTHQQRYPVHSSEDFHHASRKLCTMGRRSGTPSCGASRKDGTRKWLQVLFIKPNMAMVSLTPVKNSFLGPWFGDWKTAGVSHLKYKQNEKVMSLLSIRLAEVKFLHNLKSSKGTLTVGKSFFFETQDHKRPWNWVRFSVLFSFYVWYSVGMPWARPYLVFNCCPRPNIAFAQVNTNGTSVNHWCRDGQQRRTWKP